VVPRSYPAANKLPCTGADFGARSTGAGNPVKVRQHFGANDTLRLCALYAEKQ
jgi:hypothetical protein